MIPDHVREQWERAFCVVGDAGHILYVPTVRVIAKLNLDGTVDRRFTAKGTYSLLNAYIPDLSVAFRCEPQFLELRELSYKKYQHLATDTIERLMALDIQGPEDLLQFTHDLLARKFEFDFQLLDSRANKTKGKKKRRSYIQLVTIERPVTTTWKLPAHERIQCLPHHWTNNVHLQPVPIPGTEQGFVALVPR